MWTRLVVWLSRCRALVSVRRLDEDFDQEVAAHIDMLTEANVRRGMTPDEARRAAIVRFGGPVQIKEQQREHRGLPFVETTRQDVRYAIRALRKNPGFTAAAVLTLGIGVGATTTMFAVVQAVLLRPLPYAEPERLVRIFETNPIKHWTKNVAAPANYADWKAQNTVFENVAAYEAFSKEGSGASDVYLTGSGEPQGLKAMVVSGNLIRMLGVPPLMGRTFTDEETFEGQARVVVLSYGLWQSLFGGDRGVIGRTMMLNGRTYDVVGVMPPAFAFPGRDVQLWMPLAYAPSLFTTARRPHWLRVVARLRTGVSLDRARQDMTAIAGRLERQYPDTNTQMGVLLEPFHESLNGEQRPALLMLFSAVGVLFLIVCANIANLQFGRAVSRTREMAIRHALGAGRRRLVRQLLTESLLLSAIGGAVGLALAALARTALARWAPDALPLFADLRVDGPVLLFTAGLCLAAPIAFGLLPALTASRADRLNDRSESASRRTRSMRDVLVACEVGLSVVLVVGAVLLVRSLMRLQDVDPGFNQEHVVTFTLTLPTARYPGPAERLRAFGEIERRLREQPGVQAVGATSTLALRGFTWTGDATVEGRAPTDYERELRHESITPDYFRAMGIRLLAGRMLTERDVIDQPRVTVVNEALARKYFPGADPVGKRITFGRPQDNSPWVTIVGVVADEKQDGMDKPVAATGVPKHCPGDAEPAHLRGANDVGRGGCHIRRPAAGAGRRQGPRADDGHDAESRRRSINGRSSFPHDAAVGVRGRWRCCSRRSAFTACSRISSRSVRASSGSGWRSARGRRRCSAWSSVRGCVPWPSVRSPACSARWPSPTRCSRCCSAWKRLMCRPTAWPLRSSGSSPSRPARCPPSARCAWIRWWRSGERLRR